MFGPSVMKAFGTPLTVTPRYACGLPAQRAASGTPSRPRIRAAIGGWLTSKPVPKMIVSTSRVVPSAATIDRSPTSASACGISSTLRAVSAG
jgi:hypothetical protein